MADSESHGAICTAHGAGRWTVRVTASATSGGSGMLGLPHGDEEAAEDAAVPEAMAEVEAHNAEVQSRWALRSTRVAPELAEQIEDEERAAALAEIETEAHNRTAIERFKQGSEQPTAYRSNALDEVEAREKAEEEERRFRALQDVGEPVGYSVRSRRRR